MFGSMHPRLKQTDEPRAVSHPRATVAVAVRSRRSAYLLVGKPLLDRSVGVVLLGIASPLLAVVGGAVALRLGRPILLGQDRVGRDGEVFRMYKFRTMHPDRRYRADRRADGALDPGPAAGSDAGLDAGLDDCALHNRQDDASTCSATGSAARKRANRDRRQTHKSDRDPRHTPLGRLLRRASLDELPQLWNVVRGDMSLVGPRPELKAVVERDGLASHPRHLVRPGITGPWQLGPARNIRLSKNLHYDEGYLETMSFSADVSLLIRTLRVPFRKAGS